VLGCEVAESEAGWEFLDADERLGEYAEYEERPLRSLFVMSLWVSAAAWLLLQIRLGGGDSCAESGCVEGGMADWKPVLVDLALACFGVVAFLAWRRFFRRPGLRVGERGLEVRTQLLGHRFAPWRYVRAIEPAIDRNVFWRTADVRLVHSAQALGWPSTVRVRLSGLTEEPSEIEADMADRFASADLKWQDLDGLRLEPDESRVLRGIRVETDAGRTYFRVSSSKLLDLLQGIRPGDRYVILFPAGCDDLERYAMASYLPRGEWHVERREGTAESHVGTETADLLTVYRVMIDWVDHSPDWRDRLDWRPLAHSG
jgi:hypothetical protein